MKIKLYTFILSVFLIHSSLFAVTLVSDSFRYSLNKWRGRDVSLSRGWMRIKKDATATKKYNFGSSYANSPLTINFRLFTTLDWDMNDDFNVLVNGKIIQTFNQNDGTYKYSVTTNADKNGNITLAFNSNTSNREENSYIDYVTITTPNPNSISISNVKMNEGNYGSYTKKVPVTLINPNGNTVSVDYITSNGTAFNGSDYNATSGTLIFTGTDTTKMIEVNINGDNIQEPDETFNIKLKNPIGASILDGSSKITLLNDDGGSTNNGLRNFLIRNPQETRNIKGNLKVIGNTVLQNTGSPRCYSDYYDTWSDCTNTQIDLHYINIAKVNYPFKNSSQAKLDIPATAIIKWAGVYTQGYIDDNTDVTNVSNIIENPIYLTVPSIGTFPSTPLVSNIYPNEDDGYTYSTFSEVKELKDKLGSNVNGWITAANIKAYEGKEDSGLGNFGAWTLVVVYQDDKESLKNISVFDGYRKVSKNKLFKTVDININGFLTPTNGDISSSLSIFVGEGDKNIYGDKLYVSNKAGVFKTINDTNAFRSITSGFNANPKLTNNQGIDIQNYNIGNVGKNHFDIIQKSQNSATIRLTSTGDVYFPSMVAFTTELYEPRVCYHQEILDENGNELSKVNIGDIVTVKTWISNMKKIDPITKLPETGDLETADKVEVTMNLDSVNLKYIADSTSIKNIGETQEHNKTDSKDGDTAEFLTDTNTSVWRVGSGSSGADGGKLLPNLDNKNTKKVFIKFKTTLLQSGDLNIRNKYFVSYENSLLGVRFGDESPFNIEVCKAFDTSISVGAPKGLFNVVNENFSGNEISNDKQSALYTQVSGKDFKVKIIALNSELTTLENYEGNVTLSIIKTPNFQDSTDKQKECDEAEGLWNSKEIKFDDENFKEVPLNYTFANKKVSFKISFTDQGVKKHVCSSDSFAIRPAGYSIDANETKLIGGKNYKLDINSTNGYVPPTTDGVLYYNQTIDTSTSYASASYKLVIPTGCIINPTPTTINISGNFDSLGRFQKPNFSYANVGDINITVVDTKWTKVDQNKNGDSTNNDCIINNSSNIPHLGKVGCNINTSKILSFSPKEFRNKLTLQNFNGGNFTYINNDRNMSARLFLNITAILENNNPASNYTANCYAKDINTTISLRSTNVIWDNNWTNESNATQRIRFFDDKKLTSRFENNNTVAQTIFSSNEGNFTNGIANINMSFNFQRFSNIPDNPFHVARNDFNVTVIDTNDTNGSDFKRTLNDSNATFYYGRVHGDDQTITGVTGLVNVYYEVYCQDCNKTNMNISGNESIDSIEWFINTLHTNSDGNVSRYKSISDVKFGNVNYYSANNTQDNLANINNGLENVQLVIRNAPYKDKIDMNSSSWLKSNPTDFIVDFISSGQWAGEGKLDGVTVDLNISSSRNKRLDW